MSLKILSLEISNDPLSRGYAEMTDQQIVESLMIKNRSVNKTALKNTEILEAIETSALLALTGDQATRVWGVLGMDSVNPFGNAAKIFIDAFGNPSNTLNALASLRTETISRAKELGINSLSAQIVANAKAGKF